MTEDPRTIGAAILAAIIVLGVVLAAVGRRRDKTNQIQIAKIVDQQTAGSGVFLIFLMFMGSSFLSFLGYVGASTFEQQVVALLSEIAGSCFWGVCLLVGLITLRRRSVVYRELPPPVENQRADPNTAHLRDL